MPYADCQGIRIYYEVEGKGPPLILAHGSADNQDMWWRQGYVNALSDDFQLILYDARGHGLSDKPHETSAYGTEMASDVVAVLDSLEIPKAHFFGYSMGAATGFALATSHIERFHSFILGGMSPYGLPVTMIEAVQISIEGFKLLLTDHEAYFLHMEGLLGHPLTDEDRKEFLSKDAEALIAMQTALFDVPPLTEQELAGISLPCLVYCGDRDPFFAGALEGARNMPLRRFISLPGVDHITAFLNSGPMVPHIKEFLVWVIEKRY